MKRTPLYQWHVSRGARGVGFGGWEMPVQYTGIIDEHHSTRAGRGPF
jgi:aminomethyltransferase